MSIDPCEDCTRDGVAFGDPVRLQFPEHGVSFYSRETDGGLSPGQAPWHASSTQRNVVSYCGSSSLSAKYCLIAGLCAQHAAQSVPFVYFAKARTSFQCRYIVWCWNSTVCYFYKRKVLTHIDGGDTALLVKVTRKVVY